MFPTDIWGVIVSLLSAEGQLRDVLAMRTTCKTFFALCRDTLGTVLHDLPVLYKSTMGILTNQWSCQFADWPTCEAYLLQTFQSLLRSVAASWSASKVSSSSAGTPTLLQNLRMNDPLFSPLKQGQLLSRWCCREKVFQRILTLDALQGFAAERRQLELVFFYCGLFASLCGDRLNAEYVRGLVMGFHVSGLLSTVVDFDFVAKLICDSCVNPTLCVYERRLHCKNNHNHLYLLALHGFYTHVMRYLKNLQATIIADNLILVPLCAVVQTVCKGFLAGGMHQSVAPFLQAFDIRLQLFFVTDRCNMLSAALSSGNVQTVRWVLYTGNPDPPTALPKPALSDLTKTLPTLDGSFGSTAWGNLYYPNTFNVVKLLVTDGLCLEAATVCKECIATNRLDFVFDLNGVESEKTRIFRKLEPFLLACPPLLDPQTSSPTSIDVEAAEPNKHNTSSRFTRYKEGKRPRPGASRS